MEGFAAEHSSRFASVLTDAPSPRMMTPGTTAEMTWISKGAVMMQKGTPLGGDEFLVSRDGKVALLRINRVAKKNAFSLAMWRELARILTELGKEPELCAIVLCGSGGCFSAGADISEFNSVRADREMSEAYESEVDGCYNALIDLPKPTVAAISGACMGGGFGLATCCDFRIADASAYFGIPAARLGVVYGVDKCRSLLNVMAMNHAKKILFTGRRFSFAEVKAWGLIDEEAEGDVAEAALAFAKEFLGSAPLAVAGMKAVLHAIAAGDVARRLPDLNRAIHEAAASNDYREAVAAFAAKRPPNFRAC